MTQSEYIEQVNELLEELYEYFADKADADWQGDPGKYVVNKEGQKASEISNLLDRSPKKQIDF